MKEKGKNIFTRIRDWWKDLDPVDKSKVSGIILGSVSTFAGCALGARRWQNKYIDSTERDFDASNKLSYLRGVQDGQVKAYRDLLVNPQVGFNKIGLETKKF